MTEPEPGRLPTLHIVADSIPQAYFRAIKAVWENGAAMRTEYDRKDDAGEYIDPPSRDARVLIEVKDPFSQPRFPPISFCEIGVYIAEIMGAKDYKVLPMSKLLAAREGKPLPTSEWPYTYHKRFFAHPELAQVLVEDVIQKLERIERQHHVYLSGYSLAIQGLIGSLLNKQKLFGGNVDQIAKVVETLVRVPHSRRAICTTAVPNLDPFLIEDIPCLRELQPRCVEDENGDLVLNVSTVWRSRDLYKAWSDNVIAVTFLLQIIAQQIEAKMLENGVSKKVRVGSYADYSGSLHIYGQDFGAVAGDEVRGLQSFFETFDEESFVARSLDSDTARDMLVLSQLKVLLEPKSIGQWKFPPESIELVKDLIAKIESGQLIV